MRIASTKLTARQVSDLSEDGGAANRGPVVVVREFDCLRNAPYDEETESAYTRECAAQHCLRCAEMAACYQNVLAHGDGAWRRRFEGPIDAVDLLKLLRA